MHTETLHLIIEIAILIALITIAITLGRIFRLISGIFSNTSDGGVVIHGPGPKRSFAVNLAEKD